jgi:hypothetical protein
VTIGVYKQGAHKHEDVSAARRKRHALAPSAQESRNHCRISSDKALGA